MKNHMRLTSLMICLLLSGCGTDERQRELQGYINQLKTTAQLKEVKSKPKQWALPKAVVYNPHGYTGTANNNNKAPANATANPLQAYPVKSLQFVGIISQNNQISAYVMTPDSMIYLVNVGDAIGEDYGKIVKIDSDRIEIMEKTMSGSQPADRTVELKLKDSPE